jgi:hypothetical protein
MNKSSKPKNRWVMYTDKETAEAIENAVLRFVITGDKETFEKEKQKILTRKYEDRDSDSIS